MRKLRVVHLHETLFVGSNFGELPKQLTNDMMKFGKVTSVDLSLNESGTLISVLINKDTEVLVPSTNAKLMILEKEAKA